MSLSEENRVRMSKTMSKFLRHHLEDLKCPVTADGYVPLSALLRKQQFRGATLDDIRLIVTACNKQRFTLMLPAAQRPEDYDPSVASPAIRYEDSVTEPMIRANQGHSHTSAANVGIVDEAIHEVVTEPLPYLVHGTKSKYADSIRATGLNRMARSHIHFISTPDAKSGFRPSSDALIHVDMKAAMEGGIVFYRSANDVILSEGIDGIIPAQYISEIEIRDVHRK
jgi:2'-phosphotransferase